MEDGDQEHRASSSSDGSLWRKLLEKAKKGTTATESYFAADIVVENLPTSSMFPKLMEVRTHIRHLQLTRSGSNSPHPTLYRHRTSPSCRGRFIVNTRSEPPSRSSLSSPSPTNSALRRQGVPQNLRPGRALWRLVLRVSVIGSELRGCKQKENRPSPDPGVQATNLGSPNHPDGANYATNHGNSKEKSPSCSSSSEIVGNPLAPQRGVAEGVDNELLNGGSDETTGQDVGARQLKMSDVRAYFHLSVANAAKKLRVSLSTLKNACRIFGLERWPGRKVKSLQSTIGRLKHAANVGLEELNEAYMPSEVCKLQHEIEARASPRYSSCTGDTENVTDYRYEITGIKPADFNNAPSFKRVRAIVKRILGDRKLLVGHDLRHDLACLRLDHPPELIRDTATYQLFVKTSGVSHKLRFLTEVHLGYKIQEETSSHDPCEDAVAAMRLYKRIRSQRHAGDFDVSQLSLLNGGSAKSVYSYSEPTFYCWCLDSMIVSVDDQQGEIYGLSAA